MADNYVQVFTTTDSREKADRLAWSAVENRLAACAQVIGPMTSTYWWQGQIEAASEWLCVFKTTTVRCDQLSAHLRDQHTYETPEIVATPIVGGNPDYLSWIARETAVA
ncbi:MAG TPA: divalent-cation tolerance protein CutA [Candidatus Dormibacteraeota bacterium]|nr:divalent-cation tolerance protein CutA [Candidatus Dormibacteraeota bacterium]